jgi:hypothetical protein
MITKDSPPTVSQRFQRSTSRPAITALIADPTANGVTASPDSSAE